MTNYELILLFRRGDNEAFKELYRQYYRPMVYFSNKIINNTTEAEDITVEVFMKLFKKVGDFDNMKDIQGFLYTASKNLCTNFLISERSRKEREIKFGTTEDEEYFTDALIIETKILDKVLNNVKNLSDTQQSIFNLMYVEGLKTSLIAEILGISVNTIGVQKMRMMAHFRNLFKQKT